jgi:predicted ATPase
VLLGRDGDLAALRAHLTASRLVTVTGVGGVGKTALALAAAGTGRDAVCELAAVTRASDVSVAVGEALGFPSLDAALVGLSGVRMLVVLDNCEHVLDAAADAAGRLLATCSEVSVLATSREPLDLPGERVVPLPPLALPTDDDPEALRDSPAAALLLSRARDAGGELALDLDSAPSIAALCRRLDGLPLALELAAARTRSLTPAEILAHLDQRLDLLSRSRDRGPWRHRSLETAIEWSYARLPEPTARFFDRLGVFDGRFTAQEAHAVAGTGGADVLAVVEQLDHLVSRSMLTVRQQVDRSWYGLLDTLRAFARARLAERGELDAVQDRWVDRLVELATGTRWDAALSGGPDARPPGLGTQTDVLNAVRWCLDRDGEPDRAVVLVRQLVRAVYRARPEPVAELGEALLERWPDRTVPAWAEFAAVTGFAHMAVRNTERAAAIAGETLAAEPSPFAEVLALRTLSFHEVVAGRPDRALAWTDRAIGVADARGAPAWASEMRTYRASALVALGRFRDAVRQADDARAQAVAAGGGFPEVLAALIRANLLVRADPALARQLLTGVAERSRDGGHPLVEGPCSWSLARIALRDGAPVQAAEWLSRALELFVRIGHTLPLRVTLRWVAVLVRAGGRAEAAARLCAAAGTAHTLTLYEWPWSDLADPADEPADADTVAPPLREAVALARRELGAVHRRATGADADARPWGLDPAARREPNRFQLDGAVWTASFDGRTVLLPDAKGMHDLARLLARPGREVHCTELVGAAVEQPADGELLDAQARRGYEARIRQLQDDLDEAEHGGDRGRAEAARRELDLLVDHLAAATGLHGRGRRPGGTAERARSAVTWRIRAALRRIEEVHPRLGRHLRGAIRTGTWCCYAPEGDVAWRSA